MKWNPRDVKCRKDVQKLCLTSLSLSLCVIRPKMPGTAAATQSFLQTGCGFKCFTVCLGKSSSLEQLTYPAAAPGLPWRVGLAWRPPWDKSPVCPGAGGTPAPPPAPFHPDHAILSSGLLPVPTSWAVAGPADSLGILRAQGSLPSLHDPAPPASVAAASTPNGHSERVAGSRPWVGRVLLCPGDSGSHGMLEW